MKIIPTLCFTGITSNSITSGGMTCPIRRRIVGTWHASDIHIKRQQAIFNVKFSENFDHLFNQMGPPIPSLCDVLIVHFMCRPQWQRQFVQVLHVPHYQHWSCMPVLTLAFNVPAFFSSHRSTKSRTTKNFNAYTCLILAKLKNRVLKKKLPKQIPNMQCLKLCSPKIWLYKKETKTRN